MSDQSQVVSDLLTQYKERRLSRRDFFQRATQAGVTASGAALLLAACGSSSSPASSAAQTGTKPVLGGTLREGYNRDVSPIDPVSTVWWDAGLFPVTHETLLTADASGKFVPLMAGSWETSSDGLTWTFHLRPGLKFQSGAPCDATAVAEALTIISKQGVNAGFWSPVTKVAAAGPTTVEIKLAHPYADLPFVLNTGYSAVFNPAARKKLGDQYGTKGADGTGPFTLAALVPGSHSSYKRWPHYPGSGASSFFTNKGPAYLDGIQFVVLLEPGQRAQELLANQIDALLGPAPQDVPSLQSNPDIAVVEYQEWGMFQLGPNFANVQAGFDKPEVRQALSMAIDRDAICKSIFFGKAVPAYTLVPPAFPWYETSVASLYPYDPEKAKHLLASAGHTSISFTSIVETDHIEQEVAQAVQAMFAKVGVNMSLQVHGADYFTVIGKSQAYMLHNVWPYMFDASLLFSDSHYMPPTCCNFMNVKLPPLDAAYADWQSASDQAALESSSRKAQMIFAQQLPFIPIVTPLNIWAHNQKVHNWLPTQPNLYPFYQDVFLSS